MMPSPKSWLVRVLPWERISVQSRQRPSRGSGLPVGIAKPLAEVLEEWEPAQDTC